MFSWHDAITTVVVRLAYGCMGATPHSALNTIPSAATSRDRERVLIEPVTSLENTSALLGVVYGECFRRSSMPVLLDM
jgi:hypothetical protein